MTTWEKVWLLSFILISLGAIESDILKYCAGIDQGISAYLVYGIVLLGLLFIAAGKKNA